ncbi:MAG TPA: histidine phosphatase family protein [Pseudonocardiaceae bacterium]|jgi:probable phosphoglycerate mutase|nr:histidine phosphatase family protein [Pseudonocardiaceae bacterium]
MTQAQSPAAEAALLYLVRHGESTWNAEGRCQGQSATAGGLSPAGHTQAKATAQELVKKLASDQQSRAESIVVSDLLRARQTAEIIAAELRLPVRVDAELREQCLGDLQGRRYRDTWGEGTVQDAIDELWRDPFRRPPGGESVADMYERVQRALLRLATEHTGRLLVVVTHGGVVRTASADGPPRPGIAMPHTTVDNASITSWSTPCPVS